MAIFSEEIAKRIKGSLMEKEDWWRLCYDSETQRFYVEHEWSHTDAYRASKGSDEGTTEHDAETWSGPGAEKIGEARERLLNQART